MTATFFDISRINIHTSEWEIHCKEKFAYKQDIDDLVKSSLSFSQFRVIKVTKGRIVTRLVID
jgi:hypothetical protein